MTNNVKILIKRYNAAAKAKVGDTIECPSCGTKFVKTHHLMKFCKTKEKTVCKDYYWNNVTPEKRNNTTRISPANARFRAEHNIGNDNSYNDYHPYEGLSDNEYKNR